MSKYYLVICIDYWVPEVKSKMHQAFKEEKEKPTIIEAYVDPLEPPMPTK